MEKYKPFREEYEVVAYPKLQYVRGSVVEIISRNTHAHRAYELGLVLKGSAQVHLGNRSFPITEGSLFFFNAHEAHEIIAGEKQGITIAYLQVANGFCGEHLTCFRNLEVLENDMTGNLPSQQNQLLTKLFIQALQDYLSDMDPLYALRCISSISKLYAALFQAVPHRQLSDAAYMTRNKKMARLIRITSYIEQNAGEKISLEELANKEGVTTTYLSHFIRDNLPMTFQSYVANVRYHRALKLLRSTTMSLTDVSVVSGFSDVKYLSKLLEKNCGVPAQEAVKILRSNPAAPDPTQSQIFLADRKALELLQSFCNKKGLSL